MKERRTNFKGKTLFAGILLAVFTMIFSTCATANTKKSSEYVRNGGKHFVQKDYDSAIADYNEAIRLDRKNSYAYSARANVYEEKRDWDSAIADYTEVIRLTQKRLNLYLLYYERASVYGAKGDWDSAIADLNGLIRKKPKNGFLGSYYALRGDMYKYKEEWDRAIADYTESLKLYNDNMKYAKIGEIYIHKKDYANAIKNYNQAIQMLEYGQEGRYSYFYNDRGVAYERSGDINSALADYNKAFSLNPKNSAARANIYRLEFAPMLEIAGNALKKNDYATASAQYKKILAKDPNNIEVKFELANLSRERNDYSTAIALYKEILQFDPNHKNAKNNLNVVWHKRIAENQRLYPAPFEGKWQYYQAAKIVTIPGSPGTPTRTETYTDYVSTYVRPSSFSSGYWASSPVTRTRTIPGTPGTPDRTVSIPEVNTIYEFEGSNYTVITATGTKTTGTFYYSGEKIDLSNGTFLQFSNNTISGEINVLHPYSQKTERTKVNFQKISTPNAPNLN